MSKILGLDLGTNSIGWAVVDNEKKHIEGAGSRILPMDAGLISDFEKGNPVPLTAERTRMRGARRLRERYLLRRSRLLRVLRLMGYLPEHYAAALDRHGNLPADEAPRLAWRRGKDGKHEFLFRDSFLEMAEQFRRHGHEGPLPADWTLYYLRQKALDAPISREELAWVLLQFNQKRGYNQLRGKDDGLADQSDKEYLELRVLRVEESDEAAKGGAKRYNVVLENGWTYTKTARQKPDWEGSCRAFVATYKLDKEGNRQEGQPSLAAPSEDDWGLRKVKTEHDIANSGLTLGQYIYRGLLEQPGRKVIGEWVQTVDRSLYRDELHRILESQCRFHPELRDEALYQQCVDELYPHNEAHRHNIAHRGFVYLLAEDVLLYQRPLKSKRSLIADCPFEQRAGRSLKCIAKSHPLYQEFRLWQFMANLRLYRGDDDITAELLPDDEAYTALFDHLAQQKEVDQKGLLRWFKLKKTDLATCRWNYPPDRKYPMGETRAVMLGGLRKANLDEHRLTPEVELQLWHVMYSVDDQHQYRRALRTFAEKQGWSADEVERFATAFDRLTVYKEKDYGAYSHKALSRLLPLMRRGRYWSLDAIDIATRQRIDHLITGEADDTLGNDLRQRFHTLQSAEECQGLNTWQACYLVYGRHSEALDAQPWTTPEAIDSYLVHFRHHSLNNPIVEQIVTESLRVVRDVWRQHGKPDEIHIELGRELKKTAAERQSLSQSIAEGENTNQRIRMLLAELKHPDCEVEGVRPHSPSQLELLKLYEEGVLRSVAEIPEDIRDIHRRFTATKNQPSHAEVRRYKLWLDQQYVSPYTGRPISLAKLFTSAYEIEHIIPQSKWFDDSMSNKVICEAEVNRLKGNMLGHEFISKYGGQRVPLTLGGTAEVLSVQQYEELVKRQFAANRTKLRKLMLDEVPDDFNARQLVDTRYISRLMMHLLSNIVRTTDDEGRVEQEATSRRVLPCTGAITDRLKREWGLDDVWNRIILPRFERMNELTASTLYTNTTSNGHLIPTVPMELQQGFNKKRIDHRHHALDAIVIACTTRDHVNLLNNEAAASTTRYDLQHKLRETEQYIGSDNQKHTRFAAFRKPWPTFTEEVFGQLLKTVVSFKQNLRVVNKTTNRYSAVREGKHITLRQQVGDNRAIRKPLHKETVYGEVRLQLKKRVPVAQALKQIDSIVNRELKAKIKEKKRLGYSDKQVAEFLAKSKDVWSEAADGKIEIYYMTDPSKERYFATRKPLVDVVGGCTTAAQAEKAIATITDSGIRSILMAHLAACNHDAAFAFSPEGLEQMNQNITALNGGHPHMPIKRVRKFEQANKFSVSDKGQKATKFVEAAKGTNLFFVIYTNAKGERGYATVPFKMVVELQKRYEKEWQQHLGASLLAEGLMPAGAMVLYLLSPGDLVYVPTEGEHPTPQTLDHKRIYKVVSCTGTSLHCVPHSSASPIMNKVEYEALNKMETTIDKQYSIKKVCIPIHVDRLGVIVSIG